MHNLNLKIKLEFLLVMLMGITLVFTSCSKDKDDDPAPSPSPSNPQIAIDIGLIYGTQTLDLNSTTYTNAAGEQFTVSKFKFYLSNVKLIDSNNNEVAIDDTYFLIDLADQASHVLNLTDLPAGTYKGMKFIIGVDSTRNVSGAQTGALDPANGMFWSWNTGYIFLKLEGNSPAVASPGDFEYHIGGFKQPYNSAVEVDLSFGTYTLNTKSGSKPEVHVVVDLEEFFKNPTLSIASNPNVTMPGPMAKSIADGYKDMFQFDHIHDD